MAESRTVPTSEPILQFDVEYPDHLSRLLIFFKSWLLVIPHQIIVSLLGYAVVVTSVLAWFAILFTGRYPRGLFNFAMLYMRWNARVFAYQLLLRDEYPPFGEGSYPVVFELDYPERLSRWKIFFKGIFVIPHIIVLSLLGIAAYIITIVAWFAILFTGRYPQGMFTFMVGVLRWGHRVGVYVFLLTDAYPPFTLGPAASPTTGFAAGAA